MNEKGIKIIEAAIKLFAKKGYHATSMQEIADESGVSKGSVYNHFDSKENLVLSIFKYYYELLIEKILQVSEDESLSPKERLVEQVHVQFQEFLRHRNFIEMQMHEKAIQVNEELTAFLFQIRSNRLERYKREVIGLYGEEAKRYGYDLATLLNAMISEYIGYLIIDKMQWDLRKLAQFIVERLDDIAKGMIEKQPEPFINKRISAKVPGPYQEVKRELEEIRERASAAANSDDLLDSLDVLEKELAAAKPRKVVIQGMIAILNATEDEEIKKLVVKITKKII
ncbi:MAG TPA: TetR/AcrR family transcriptional regulator [Bacillales bacterium]|nr:TetR/AcrR family transcriptional regulator [Bacillales bacterium]